MSTRISVAPKVPPYSSFDTGRVVPFVLQLWDNLWDRLTNRRFINIDTLEDLTPFKSTVTCLFQGERHGRQKVGDCSLQESM